MYLSKYIDHTNLKPTATASDITKLCKEAIEQKFFAVCVNGTHINLAKESLQDSEVKLAVVLDFPLGAGHIDLKGATAEYYSKIGADEIDMVINIGKAKEQDYDYIRDEINQVKSRIGDKILKVIIETCYFSDDEIIALSKAFAKTDADYIKTSTGFGTAGATLDHVKIMKAHIKPDQKVKASGGIRNRETAMAYIDVGAERIGTSSGIKIVADRF